MVAASYLQYELKEEIQLQRRPALLTVLCILTFIASGLNVFSYIFILTNSSASVQSFSLFANRIGLLENYEIYAVILILIVNIMTFYGALKMWKLKKSGFWMYVISKVGLTILMFGLVSFIVTAFIVALYSLSYKELE